MKTASEHAVGICRLVRDLLDHVPVLVDETVFQTEDLDNGPAVGVGPAQGVYVQDHVIPVGEDLLDLAVGKGSVGAQKINEFPEPLRSVFYQGIVLPVSGTHVPLCGLIVFLVDDQIVEFGDELFVSLQIGVHIARISFPDSSARGISSGQSYFSGKIMAQHRCFCKENGIKYCQRKQRDLNMSDLIDVIINIIVGVSILLFDFIVCEIYSQGIHSILRKERRWVRYFMIWVGLLLFQTLVYSWLPGRFGLEITYLDGLVSFTDGAFIRNLGVVLLLHTAGILLALLKYLWGVIRKKSPFLWQFALLEAGIAGICLVIGIHLVKNRSVVQFEGGKAAATAAVLILAVVLLVLVILGLRAMKREKKSSGNAKTKSPAGSGATQKASAEDPIARFDQIVEEKNRLTRSGNYAAQIPLLTEATGLALDNMRMARIWNYMGLAHEGLQSPQKAEESYRTALRFDPENPSSHNNLALLYSAGRKHDLALRYMDLALAEAKKRKLNLGLFYGNYALVVGRSGDKSKANDYLRLAKTAGYGEQDIQTIRRQLGLS